VGGGGVGGHSRQLRGADDASSLQTGPKPSARLLNFTILPEKAHWTSTEIALPNWTEFPAISGPLKEEAPNLK